jgi:hypothetical protein
MRAVKIKIIVKQIGIFILEERVKQNHQEHNVATPKVSNVVVKNELMSCMKNTLKSSPMLHQIPNKIKNGAIINPVNL